MVCPPVCLAVVADSDRVDMAVSRIDRSIEFEDRVATVDGRERVSNQRVVWQHKHSRLVLKLIPCIRVVVADIGLVGAYSSCILNQIGLVDSQIVAVNDTIATVHRAAEDHISIGLRNRHTRSPNHRLHGRMCPIGVPQGIGMLIGDVITYCVVDRYQRDRFLIQLQHINRVATPVVRTAGYRVIVDAG